MTRASGRSCRLWPAPNMRLKLAGARVGRIALPRPRAFFSALPPPCASRHCARSLSAIRQTAAGCEIEVTPTRNFKIWYVDETASSSLSVRPEDRGVGTDCMCRDESMDHVLDLELR